MSSPDPVQAQLLQLRKKYGLALPQKTAAVDSAFTTVFAGAWEEHACATAYRLVHSLAGSSGTYGYPEISGVARELEQLIRRSVETHASLEEAPKAEAEALLARLRGMAAELAGPVSG